MPSLPHLTCIYGSKASIATSAADVVHLQGCVFSRPVAQSSDDIRKLFFERLDSIAAFKQEDPFSQV